jgi:flagellar assembly factor FliW
MNVLESSRFGRLQYAEQDVITLAAGLVGLPRLKRWILLDMERDLPLKWLQSLDDGSFGFPVTTPEYFHPEYDPSLPADLAGRLGSGSPGELAVLIVTTVHPGGARLTGNLAAPLLIHTGSRRGLQHVAEDGAWPLRQEIDYVRFGLAAAPGTAQPAGDRAVGRLTAAAGAPVGERQEITL